MPITVNGVELCDDEIVHELPLHQDAEQPLQRAVLARVLRRVLLDEAQRQGIDPQDEEQAVSRLLAQHAPGLEPDEAACRRFYEAHRERYTVGACVEADHILFQVTPGVNLEALQRRARAVLEALMQAPQRFAELARSCSNCPSAAIGGSLGQLRRGETVPEFERVIFSLPAGTLHPSLVHSRHGLHIVRVTRSVPGRSLPYEAVAADIARVLAAMARDHAWRQYVKVLVSRARIEGVELDDTMEADRLMGVARTL